jgi:hypothetical protein
MGASKFFLINEVSAFTFESLSFGFITDLCFLCRLLFYQFHSESQIIIEKIRDFDYQIWWNSAHWSLLPQGPCIQIWYISACFWKWFVRSFQTVSWPIPFKIRDNTQNLSKAAWNLLFESILNHNIIVPYAGLSQTNSFGGELLIILL